MRIGLFGGSFDPVHLGHLWIAEFARESLCLDEVRWIPAAQSPLKPSAPIATNEERLTMIRLAISGATGHTIDPRELQRAQPSYTVDTVEEICAEDPHNDYFLIAGSDSLASMPNWRSPERILRCVTLSVVRRGGDPPIDYSVLNGIVDGRLLESILASEISMPAIEVSSTEIRNRIKRNSSIRYQVPHAVEVFLQSNKIYR